MEGNLLKRDGDEDDSGVRSWPEDIILEVLRRLPAKALCRFQCVCKAWRALITDPTFVAAQGSRATGPFIAAMFGSAPELELRLLDMGGNVLRVFDVRGSKALLQPMTLLDLIFVDREELGAMVIDPASGRDFTVVSTDDLPPPWVAPTLPSTAVSSNYSFGRAAVSKDYKVLRLVASSNRHGRRNWCEVATLIDGGAMPTWRQRPWGPFYHIIFSCEYNATINGVLYFVAYKPYYSRARNRIAAFDLESEEWKPETIRGPPLECSKEDDVWDISLTELRGNLCVVEHMGRNLSSLGGYNVNIWLLVDPDKSIWVKEYRIQMPEMLFLSMKLLDVSGDGRILLQSSATRKVRNDFRYILQFYNSNTEDFTDVMEMADGFNGTMTFYPGSLLS